MTKSIEEKAEAYASRECGMAHVTSFQIKQAFLCGARSRDEEMNQTAAIIERKDRELSRLAQDHMTKSSAIVHYHEKLARLEGLVREATTVIEGFQLGHEHSAGLNHIRKMGDTYGWCDFCGERVSFGPGEAEQFLAKLRREAPEGGKS